MESKLNKYVRGGFVTALKAALNLAPAVAEDFFPGGGVAVGGAMASWVDDLFGEATNKAVQETLDRLNERVVEMGERIDAIESAGDDLAEVVKRYLLLIQMTHRRERQDASNEILVNALLKPSDPDKLEFSDLELFALCVERLPLAAYQVLAAMQTVEQNSRGNQRMSFGQVTAVLPPDFDENVAMAMINQLQSYGLATVSVSSVRYDGGMSNYPVELTPLGERFADRIAQRVCEEPAA